MLAIYKKELRTYFTSMIGYVFVAFFLALIGIFFTIENLAYGVANFERTLSDLSFFFVLLIPLLTMRLMAEENRQKTDQLLLTSPLSAESIVMGKFLSVFTIFLSVMAVICFYPLILYKYGSTALASGYSSILGFTLLGATYLAMGLFISSLTESQVIAAVVSYIVFIFTAFMEGIATKVPSGNKATCVAFIILLLILCVILYVMMHNLTFTVCTGLIGGAVILTVYLIKPALYDGLLVKLCGWLSVTSRFNNFYIGILDLTDVVYYISITFLFLFLTTQVIKKKRWS
jgi:ABC-2 type transport system permease protein